MARKLHIPCPGTICPSLASRLICVFGLFLLLAVLAPPALSQTPITNGLVLWLDASQLTGLASGQQVNTWTDLSGQNNHALRQSGSTAGYPQYQSGQLNGKPVVRFNSANGNTGDYFKFNRITTIRTVFWVLRENAGASDGHFLLGDDTQYHFHRASANGPIWEAANSWSSANIRNGTTRLMGTVVNGTTTSIPASQFQVVSLVTAGNVQANQINQDRTYHGSWQGDIAEILIYTNALSAANEALVGSYLAAKYGLTTAYPPVTPAPPTGLGVTPSASSVGLNWTASAGATGYHVKRSTSSGKWYARLGTASGTEYTDGTVATGTTYYYVVSATNSAGESANSAEVSATAAASAVRTWSGGGTNDSWTSADNWAGGAPPLAGDTLVFAGAARLNNTNDFPLNTGFQGIAFNAGAGGFVLNGNGLALGGDVVDSATATQRVNVTVNMGNVGRVFSVITNGQLVVSQPISGSQGLTKDGPGTLTLTAANSYAGGTLVSDGRLRLAPSGAGSPVSGMLYWLDAADGTTISIDAANNISQWSDKSGNSRHFLQATASRQPLLVAGALGGKPVVRFDGVTDRLVLGSSTSPQTVFIVNKVTTGGGLRGIWGQNQADTGIRMASDTAWQNPGNGNDFSNPSGSVMYVNGVVSNTFTSGAAHLVEVVRASSVAFPGTGVGDYFNDAGRPFGGDIAEVLVYGRALSTAERQQVESYLMAKWLGGSGSASDLLPTSTAVNLATSGATLDLNGVCQTIGSLAGVAGSSVTLSSGTLTIGGDNTAATYSGNVSGFGSVIKEGSGTLTLGGANSFGGTTLINHGCLKVASGGSLAGSASIIVAAGALLDVSEKPAFTIGGGKRLSGSGSVTGLVMLADSAVLAPGNSRGTLTLLSGLTLRGNSVIEFKCDASADLVRISGGAFSSAPNGSTRIDVLGAGSLGTFSIVDWTGATPGGVSANAFVLGVVPAGYQGSLQIIGNSLQLTLQPTGPQAITTNTIVSLRLAMSDLAQRYAADYGFKAPGYLTRLAAIESSYRAAQAVNNQAGIQAADSAYQVLKRDALVLNNPALAFNRILFVRRSTGVGLPNNWQNVSSVGNTACNDSIGILDITNNQVSTFYTPSMSQFLGYPDLHWNAERLLFTGQALTNGTRPYTVFEMKMDGTGLKQVSPAAGSDIAWFDACYLPCGDMLMVSTATFAGVPCVTGSDYVGNLYRVYTNGLVRQLTFDQDQNWGPTILADGRVMFTRWEYSDTPHYFSRILFTMMPDGLEQFARYGSGSFFPNAIFDAKPIPGKPSQFAAIISGHHGVAREGELLLFDEAVGTFEADGVLHRYCGPNPVLPEVRDAYIDERNPWPRFVQPCPLDEKQLLVSARPNSSSKFGLYLVDQFDNITTLCAETANALMHPTPIKVVPAPPVIPDRVKTTATNGIVNISDLYFGPGLRDVPRGKIKSLRVYSVHYGYRNQGGHISIGVDGPWDVHRIIGTVPVYGDGSASFYASANTPISVQPLDEEGKALQLFRSWYTVMPGESVSCAGCHEQRNVSMVNQASIASRKSPDDIIPWFGPERGFSFLREVQPVLDKYCTGCHGGTGGFTNAAPNLYTTNRVAPPTTGNSFPQSYLSLHRYVRRTGNEGYMRLNNPGEWHADTSDLIQILQKGHYGVTLDTNAWSRLVTWIDLNVPAWGTWGEHNSGGNYANAHTRRLKTMRDYANITNDPEVYPTPAPGRSVFEAPVAPPPITPVTPPANSVFDVYGAKARRNASTNSTTPAELALSLGNGVNLVLNLVPAGSVLMGSATGYRDEAPQAVVTNSRPFYMGKFEIMNKQYALFDPTHHSGFVPILGKDHCTEGWSCNNTNQPMLRVSWAEAISYCEWLTKKFGRKFTLPTEAQWEYACRAGTTNAMWYGPAAVAWTGTTQLIAGDSFYLAGALANLAGLEYYNDPAPNQTFSGSTPPWYLCNTSIRDSWVATSDAGSLASNPFGLSGMHGNAAEWTRSTYAPYPYVDNDGRNRVVYDTNEWLSVRKVVRGGSCVDREKRATASFRTGMYAWQRGYNVGFRVVADVSTTNTGLPTASFSLSATDGLVPLTVNFDGAASHDDDGTILRYEWNFGDGTTACGTNRVIHTYTVPGNFTAVLSVTDDDGYTATATKLITAQARINNALAPVARFTASPATGAAPCRVTFDGAASTAPGGALTAWYWDFGDGLLGGGTVTAHTFKQAGRYPVSLTVVDNSGLRDTHTGTIVITGAGGNQAPIVEAGPSAFAIVSSNLTLNGSVSDDGLPNPPASFTVNWSKLKGPGAVTFGNLNATDATATFSTNGVYVLQLSATDGELTSSDTVAITVSAQGLYHSPQEVGWSPDDSLLAVADVTAHALVLVNPVSAQVVRSVALAGEPRDLLWSGTNRLYVSEHDAATVAEVNPLTGDILRRLAVGPKPSGLALVSSKGLLLVTDRGLNRLLLLDLASGETRAQVSVVREPLFVTVTPDQQFALVANHLPMGDSRDPLLGAAISLVNLNDPRDVNTIPLPAGGSSVMRPVCSPDGRWAYVPHLLGRSHLPTTQLSRGWVTTSALSIIDLQNKLVYATALFDQTDDGAANPWGVALSADGGTLWATLSGVRELGKLDLRSLHALLAADLNLRANLSYDLSTLYRSNLLQRVPLSGEGPRGLALTADQSRLALAAYFAGQLLLADTNGTVTSQIALGVQPAEDSVRRGERLFHDANGCYQRWVSCITCHPGTRADGMNWDMMNDGFGNPKNTKSLLHAPRTEPAMWTGIRANAMVGVQAGFKFIEFQAHPQQDYDDIHNFLMSLEPEPSPYWANGKLTPDALQGKAIFESAQARCLECHRANYYYADTNKYDVGTRHEFDWTLNDITGYVPPPLFELWLSAPYLHDGSALTMRDVLTTFNGGDKHGKTSHLTFNQIDQLAAYLLQIGGELPSTGTNSYRLDVVNGDGAGQYLPGSTVGVSAWANPPGLAFNGWTGQPVLQPTAPTTTLFMPDTDASVTALFQDLPGLPDSDGDGIPDSWTWLRFGHATGQAWDLSRAQDDADGDGQSNYGEYIAGTEPLDKQDYFRLSIVSQGIMPTFGFNALSAAGYGYAGLIRCYGVDSATDLLSGQWSPLPGYTNLAGANQFIAVTNVPAPQRFLRARVWLQWP